RRLRPGRLRSNSGLGIRNSECVNAFGIPTAAFQNCWNEFRIPNSYLVPRPSLISTSATRFTPLHANARFPSRVTDTLRTTPPPEGMAQVWNFSVFGSKRTIVFGFTPDSLYQMTSCIEVIP